MIALTQEKREELSKFAKATLNSLNGIEPENPNQYDDCLSEYAQMCMEIALASLTAEPVTWWTGPEPTDCGIREEIHDHESGCHQIPLYTAPPVPEIKVTEKKDRLNPVRCDAEIYLQGKADGWNDCLADIKRLNGLGD